METSLTGGQANAMLKLLGRVAGQTNVETMSEIGNIGSRKPLSQAYTYTNEIVDRSHICVEKTNREVVVCPKPGFQSNPCLASLLLHFCTRIKFCDILFVLRCKFFSCQFCGLNQWDCLYRF